MLIGILIDLEGVGPLRLVKIHKHPLLAFRLFIIKGDRVIMLVETVNDGHVAGSRKMSNMRGGLPGLSTGHLCLVVNQPESVDDHVALHRLSGVQNDGYRPWVEHLERLLGLAISSREPGSETWMGMIPANGGLFLADLLHHIHELLLIHGVN